MTSPSNSVCKSLIRANVKNANTAAVTITRLMRGRSVFVSLCSSADDHVRCHWRFSVHVARQRFVCDRYHALRESMGCWVRQSQRHVCVSQRAL